MIDEFDLNGFFAERPAISVRKIAKEFGVSYQNLRQILNGKREIPRAKRGIFLAVLKKYGAQI